MAQDAIEGLKGDVDLGDVLQQAHAVNVVIEIAPCVFPVQGGESMFSSMTEWRVSKVVPKGDSFDQVAVETQGPANLACSLRDEL